MLSLSKIVSEIHSLDVPILNYLDNFLKLLYFQPAKIFIIEFVNPFSLDISDLRYDFFKYISLITTKIDVINILGSLQALGFFQDRNTGYFHWNSLPLISQCQRD